MVSCEKERPLECWYALTPLLLLEWAIPPLLVLVRRITYYLSYVSVKSITELDVEDFFCLFFDVAAFIRIERECPQPPTVTLLLTKIAKKNVEISRILSNHGVLGFLLRPVLRISFFAVFPWLSSLLPLIYSVDDSLRRNGRQQHEQQIANKTRIWTQRSKRTLRRSNDEYSGTRRRRKNNNKKNKVGLKN